MKIDINKPVKTRDGRSVTLISDKGRKVGVSGATYPLVGYVGDSKGLTTWTADGAWNAAEGPTDHDLIQECEVWVNVYKDRVGVFHSKAEAEGGTSTVIARVRVPYTPGQFD